MAQNFYCKWCGMKFSNVQVLTAQTCMRHPVKNSKHELYEGSEKPQYTCKYCGMKFTSLQVLTAQPCMRHPTKGSKHEPAL
jgi:predicted nucleic acid-binding Zn ribbon protein